MAMNTITKTKKNCETVVASVKRKYKIGVQIFIGLSLNRIIEKKQKCHMFVYHINRNLAK